MSRNIVWGGGMLAALIVTLTPPEAGAVLSPRDAPRSARVGAVTGLSGGRVLVKAAAPAARDRHATPEIPGARREPGARRAWDGQEAVPAHADPEVDLADVHVGLADWMTAVLTLLGAALAWLLAARGPFV